MRIILDSTAKVIDLNGVPTRIWEGCSEDGVPVHAYVSLISPQTVFADELRAFDRDLEASPPPSPAADAIPARLVL
jgi:hypothetical protein